MKEFLRPPLPERRSDSDFSHEIFLMTDTMTRHPWALRLLSNFGRVMPHDLESSWRSAQITASVVTKMREEDPELFPTYEDLDTLILGSALQDIGRGTESSEVQKTVFTAGERWRDDPAAWQWDVVRRHPRQSRDLILEAAGHPDSGVAYNVAQIVYLHHSLKRKDPYPAVADSTFDTLDPIVRKAVGIVAAVDVAEAVSANSVEQGRPYLDTEEFRNQSLSDIVQGEIVVSSGIAHLVAQQTLRFKAINL